MAGGEFSGGHVRRGVGADQLHGLGFQGMPWFCTGRMRAVAVRALRTHCALCSRTVAIVSNGGFVPRAFRGPL